MQCDILPNIIILSSKSKWSYMLKLWRYIQVLINFTAYDYRYIFLSFFLIHRVFNTFLGRKDWCFEKFPWSKFSFFNQKWWKIQFFTLKMGGRLIHEFDLYTSKYGTLYMPTSSLRNFTLYWFSDYVVVGSDSGRIVILEYIPSKNTFERVTNKAHNNYLFACYTCMLY